MTFNQSASFCLAAAIRRGCPAKLFLEKGLLLR